METSRFSFDLPPELIAQHPAEKRSRSRLMFLCRESGKVTHWSIDDLPALVPRDAVMVFNNTRVRKARLYAESRRNPVRREFLLIAPIGSRRVWNAMTPRVRRLHKSVVFRFPGNREACVIGRTGPYVTLEFDSELDEAYFADHGHVPLPPYIRREDAPQDEERYQTVYASEPGSVAAPTAGLHFTDELLSRLRERGVQIEWVELRVGPGTFLPVRSEHVEDHEMHAEECTVSAATAHHLNGAMAEGRPVIAVGTTSVRTLESAWEAETGRIAPVDGSTELFIYPGFAFNVVTGMLTNFHTPRSTLLMLVCAFAGTEPLLESYRLAVRERYRFFSYGDAMLIL
jgi:S-adenosylmethionine:tRNA ribosyltransferase-isomerase